MATDQRRLAAILVADVFQSSRLMGADEAGTLASLAALRRDIIEPTVAAHSGRLFKSLGDGFLVEFASAVQAVAAALAIQKANGDGALALRIGVHLGDVVVQGDDLMGDGVNVAARIEGVAEPGGIAISRAVHEQVRDRLEVGFTDRGEVSLRNINRPVQVFMVGGEKEQSSPALALPDKPSIAVLPFQNMSGDPDQEYFADGMVEDILTALSRFKSLFVIARNSSFAYKGKAVDIKQVGRELGVRYVLEGSVRRVGGRVRITGQLIESGGHLWADRIDGTLEDIFELQDRVTEQVVAAIAPQIEQAERVRAHRKPPANLGAHDLYLRGLAALAVASRATIDEAMQHLRRAIVLDPAHSPALGMLLTCYANRRGFGLATEAEREAAEVAPLVRRALAVGGDDAEALGPIAWAEAYVLRDIEAAKEHADRAVALNPNLAGAWTSSGWINLWRGDAALALEHLQRARRLDPMQDSNHRRSALAHSCLFLGRHAEAMGWAESQLRLNPDAHPALRVMAASAALAGRSDLAAQCASRLLAVDRDFRLSRVDAYLGPYQSAEYIATYRNALELAGLPE